MVGQREAGGDDCQVSRVLGPGHTSDEERWDSKAASTLRLLGIFPEAADTCHNFIASGKGTSSRALSESPLAWPGPPPAYVRGYSPGFLKNIVPVIFCFL